MKPVRTKCASFTLVTRSPLEIPTIVRREWRIQRQRGCPRISKPWTNRSSRTRSSAPAMKDRIRSEPPKMRDYLRRKLWRILPIRCITSPPMLNSNDCVKVWLGADGRKP